MFHSMLCAEGPKMGRDFCTLTQVCLFGGVKRSLAPGRVERYFPYPPPPHVQEICWEGRGVAKCKLMMLEGQMWRMRKGLMGPPLIQWKTPENADYARRLTGRGEKNFVVFGAKWNDILHHMRAGDLQRSARRRTTDTC